MEPIRIRIRDGELEIEVEGTRETVDALLQQWWANRVPEPAVFTDKSVSRSVRGKARASRQHRPAMGADSATPKFDANGLANLLKDDDRSDVIEAKVLHTADLWRQVQLVLYKAERPLGSRDILNVLQCLDVRTDLPAVSRCLGKNRSDLTQSGARRRGVPTQYNLTGKARKEFGNWLEAQQVTSVGGAAQSLSV